MGSSLHWTVAARPCRMSGWNSRGATRGTPQGGVYYGRFTARSVFKCSVTSMRLSADGHSGSSSGSSVESAHRCTGWGASRDGTPTCSSCGSSACDRRLECRSWMRRKGLHVRFCEGGGVRVPSATRLVILCRRGDLILSKTRPSQSVGLRRANLPDAISGTGGSRSTRSRRLCFPFSEPTFENPIPPFLQRSAPSRRSCAPLDPGELARSPRRPPCLRKFARLPNPGHLLIRLTRRCAGALGSGQTRTDTVRRPPCSRR